MKRFFYSFISIFILLGFGIYLLIEIKSQIPPNSTFTGSILETTTIKKTPVQLQVFTTAFSEVPEAFAFAGGSWLKKIKLMHNVILIKHPKGNILWDSGFSKNIDKQIEQFPWWTLPFIKFETTQALIEQLPKNIKLDAVYLSHVHWDHTSGLQDLAPIKVRVPSQEHDWYEQFSENYQDGIMKSAMGHQNIQWEMIPFSHKPYEGYEKSFDLFGDGSLVFVLMSGHTPGSLGLFINKSTSERIFLVGDTTWKCDLNGMPLYKSKIGRIYSDQDIGATAVQIDHLKKLKELYPYLQLVPAHDPDVRL